MLPGVNGVALAQACFVVARHHPVYPDPGHRLKKPANHGLLAAAKACHNPAPRWHEACCRRFRSIPAMRILSSRLFWDKKVKIAILALATFIAMC